jgi:hypothetical protein
VLHRCGGDGHGPTHQLELYQVLQMLQQQLTAVSIIATAELEVCGKVNP